MIDTGYLFERVWNNPVVKERWKKRVMATKDKVKQRRGLMHSVSSAVGGRDDSKIRSAYKKHHKFAETLDAR